jgi:hypothetical protein
MVPQKPKGLRLEQQKQQEMEAQAAQIATNSEELVFS